MNLPIQIILSCIDDPLPDGTTRTLRDRLFQRANKFSVEQLLYFMSISQLNKGSRYKIHSDIFHRDELIYEFSRGYLQLFYIFEKTVTYNLDVRGVV